jgi:hypothetical protein
MLIDLFEKVKYFLGSYYRGSIGIYHNFVDKLVPINPQIKNFSICGSARGKQIDCYRVGGGKKKVLILAAIHGNEVGTTKLAHRILNWFYHYRGEFPNLTLYVIPVLNIYGYKQAIKNPDYFNRGKVGRFNKNNVDLNRNFPASNFAQYADWGHGKNFAKKTQVYCGEFGASEMEVENLITFILDEKITNVIALHNVGQDVIFDTSNEVVKKWAKEYTKKRFKIRENPNNSGSAISWFIEKDINYMSVEGTARWGSDWSKQRTPLIKVLHLINNK